MKKALKLLATCPFIYRPTARRSGKTRNFFSWMGTNNPVSFLGCRQIILAKPASSGVILFITGQLLKPKVSTGGLGVWITILNFLILFAWIIFAALWLIGKLKPEKKPLLMVNGLKPRPKIFSLLC